MAPLSASKEVASIRVFIADTSSITDVKFGRRDGRCNGPASDRGALRLYRGVTSGLGLGATSGPPSQSSPAADVAVDAPGTEGRTARRLRPLEHREGLGEEAEEPAFVRAADDAAVDRVGQVHVEGLGIDAVFADVEDAGRHLGRDGLGAAPVTRGLQPRVELAGGGGRSWKAACDVQVEAARAVIP